MKSVQPTSASGKPAVFRRSSLIRIFRLQVGTLLVLLSFPSATLLADTHTDFSLMAGYRVDNLNWNISGGSGGPNILSELTWRDLRSYQVRGDVTGTNDVGVYVRGSASYGWVQDGENQDSDYAGDNRSLEFSRSINGVDGSKVMAFQGGVGYQFQLGDSDQFQVSPLIGYSYHAQNLRMTDGRQVVSNLANAQVLDPTISGLPPVGPFPGLHSSYDATWYGPWLGADVLWEPENRGRFKMRLELHRPNYSATADWNLRDDFRHPVSFEHKAIGLGGVLELGWQELPSQRDWQWGVDLMIQRWHTGAGTDTTYLNTNYDPSCDPYCTATTRLNEVNWSSSSLNITLNRALDF